MPISLRFRVKKSVFILLCTSFASYLRCVLTLALVPPHSLRSGAPNYEKANMEGDLFPPFDITTAADLQLQRNLFSLCGQLFVADIFRELVLCFRGREPER